jgi:hypothetical protein
MHGDSEAIAMPFSGDSLIAGISRRFAQRGGSLASPPLGLWRNNNILV